MRGGHHGQQNDYAKKLNDYESWKQDQILKEAEMIMNKRK